LNLIRVMPAKGRTVTLDEYNACCSALPHSTHVVQWGGAHVWKIGGKVYAICWSDGETMAVTFKCSPTTFEMLKDEDGVQPAPYLASRGMIWLQRTHDGALSDAALKDYIGESYRLAGANLPKKRQRELGLAPA
jgi:predicted DNA-binding protein (MmcQ/YjbR family)